MRLDEIRDAVAPACRDFKVRRLDAFGSVARGTSTKASDLDLIVEFQDPASHPAKRFFGLLHRIEDALGCEVDLLTLRSLRNPYFRKRVLEERVPLYEGRSG
jgi:predicted nucleotidyltransferase